MILPRLESALQANPALGYIGSASSLGLAVITTTYEKFVQHADLAKTLLALTAALFGALAGYYTFRIQRRTFNALQKETKESKQ